MNRKLEALATRQYVLMQRIDSQRNELAEIALRLKTPLTVVDTGIKAVKFMHNHPALVTGSMTAILAWQKKGFFGMALQGVRALYLYPSVLAYVSKYLHLPNFSRPTLDEKKDCNADTAI